MQASLFYHQYNPFSFECYMSLVYADIPVASFGIKNKKAMGMKVHATWIMMPTRRLSKFPDEILRIEASPAPTNDPTVEPKLFIDIKSANKVPSIPGGQSCPDKIRKGINLQNDIPSQVTIENDDMNENGIQCHGTIRSTIICVLCTPRGSHTTWMVVIVRSPRMTRQK